MGFRFIRNTMTLDFPANLSRTEVLALIFGLPICLGIGISIAIEQYLFAFVLLAFLLAFAILLLPYLGLLLFLCLTYIRPQDTFPGLIGKPIIFMLLGLTIGCWLLRILIFRQREFVKVPQNLFFLALLPVVVLSCVPIWLLAAKDAFIDFSKILLIYFLIVNSIDTRRKFVVALWAMFLGTIYIAMLGTFQHYEIAPEIAGTTDDINLGRIQGFGIFDSANYLAYGVAFMIPFAIYSFYYSSSWPLKLFSLLAAFVVFLPCIHFTGSRGALLCAALTILFCLFQDRKLKIISIGVLISICVIFVLLRTIPVLGTVSAYKDDGSAMGRIEAWRGGFYLLRASPLLGVGYRNFMENWERAAHNSFVEVGTELGLIGLFVWIGLLYWSYKYLAAVIQDSDRSKAYQQKAYGKSLKAALFAYVIASFFASLGNYMLIYIFHSFAAVAGQLYLPEEKRKQISRILPKDLLAIGVIEIVVLCIWYISPRL